MKMETRIAFSNAKFYKSKNILTGISILLTTLLLFLVPTVGLDILSTEKAAICELYPSWHALFREVSEDTAAKLSSHHLVKTSGKRCDLGCTMDSDIKNSLIYMDDNACTLYRLSLSEGTLPAKENEIAVSKNFLKQLSLDLNVGDSLPLSYQVRRKDGLDFAKKKDFVISGFLADTMDNEDVSSFTSLISEALLKKELSEEETKYRFLFQINSSSSQTTDEMKEQIMQLALQFDIRDSNMRINDNYLRANYVDPSFYPILLSLMVIIVFCGIITIYSIYYLSIGERVQELGKIKAIGAAPRQLKKIVLREGMIVSGIAIPLGLLLGSLLIKPLFGILFGIYQEENELTAVMQKLLNEDRLSLFVPWVYVVTILTALFTVYLALLHPMRTASKISEVEAMRYHEKDTSAKQKRKGYLNLSIARLTKVHLGKNKKRSLLTICSMSVTGLLFMSVATILSCADPREAANNSITGEYMFSVNVSFGDKEHPELEWGSVQKNNPLTEEFKQEILKLNGIQKVICFPATYCVSDAFPDDKNSILGIPESQKETLEQGIIEGNISYEELKSGDKAVIDENLLHWYPDLKIGQVLDVTVDNGDESISKKIEIAAIGDYNIGFTNYSYILMAEEGLNGFSNYSLNHHYAVFANEKYNKTLESELKALGEKHGNLEFTSWNDHYKTWKDGISMTKMGCYIFLGILGAICIMNMINTMISSVHARKKELGMLQAIGMSDHQLLKMLQLESLFYTFGTILIAATGGSALGYPLFLWAKKNAMYNISSFHYPAAALLLMIGILLLVQAVTTLALSKAVRKDSLIDRIRFYN